MSAEVKLRRGSTADHATFTGGEGEVTADTDKDTLILHDNSTVGGFEMLRTDFSNIRTLVTGNTASTTWSNLGTITTVDINGGTIDGSNIGAAVPGSGAFTTLSSTGATTLADAASDVLIVNSGNMRIPNNLSIDGNTIYIDATNDRVAIGNTSPLSDFHVQGRMSGSAFGVSAHQAPLNWMLGDMAYQNAQYVDVIRINAANTITVGSGGISGSIGADDIVISRTSGNTGISILSSTSGASILRFGDSGNPSIGGLIYNNTTNSLALEVNGSEAIRVNSSQQVGIGTVSPTAPLHVAATGSQIRIEDTDGGTDAGISVNSSILTLGQYGLTTSGNVHIDILNNRLGIGLAPDAGFVINSGLNTNTKSRFKIEPSLQSSGTALGARLAAYGSAGTPVEFASIDLACTDDTSGAEAGALVFNTMTAGTLSQVGIVTGTGKFGIGTATPSTLLHIKETNASTHARLTIQNSGGDEFDSNMNLITTNRSWLIGARDTAAGFTSGAYTIFDETAALYRMIINSSGNVGFGTFSPESKLHIQSGDPSGAVAPATNADELLIESSASGGITIGVPASSQARINFAGGSNNDAFSIMYDQSSDYIAILNDGVEILRFDTNGALDLTSGTSGGILTDTQSLPTSDPSVTGKLWNDSGTVKVSA